LLNRNVFSIIDNKIHEAGSSDPREVAEYFGIMVVDLLGSIAGYATHYSFLPVIGLNTRLKGNWYMFGGWHELAHVFDGHIYETGFTNGHCDSSFFNKDVDSRTISDHERIANLVSANVTISDEAVFDVTNYNSETMRSYRELKAFQKEQLHSFEQLKANSGSPMVTVRLMDLKKQIDKTGSAISDLEFDIVASNCIKTFSEIAMELGISERILHYKLEAMRIRGIDIDRQELERYEKMFSGAV